MQASLNIADLLPHAGPMCLLHRLIEVSEALLIAEADILADNLFLDGGVLGGWVGIEYMAQAVAGWSGYQAWLVGRKPQIGYLLGTRSYKSSRSIFNVGETLRIYAVHNLQMETGLSRFDCRIELNGEAVAQAALNLYQPNDPLHLPQP